jgi:glycosyltransferase involved in cell wall biosynthesis
MRFRLIDRHVPAPNSSADAAVPRRPVRVALVMDHPAQQFTRGLQLLSADPDVEVEVCYWSVAQHFYDRGFDRQVSWDVNLLDGYTWAAPSPTMSVIGRLRWFVSRLRMIRPETVVCYGWASPIAKASIIFCLLSRTRVLLYGDTTWQHASVGRHPLVRSVALRLLMRLCAGAVSTGTFNREFYIRYGMHPRFIWPGVCPADTELFGLARTNRCGPCEQGHPDLRIGFAGKLIERKGVDELLQASALLPRARDWSVSVIGDGPLMPELQALAGQLGISDRVTFHGFANTSQMPKLLAGLDVVVVPSRLDMRVLVTVEVMAAGTALVVSDATAVWGPGDLVEDGVTGLVYRSGEPAALARQLCRLLDEPGLVAMLGANGADRAAGFGPDSFARTIASAARMCANGERVSGTGES